MLRIQMTKHADGSVVLRCTRADGSSTWQKQTKHAAHFVLHDLTHYAVETTLGCRQGFFGLIAAGWEIEDTTGKGARGPLPSQTTDVEKVVGLFDSERGAGVLWTAAEFNQFSSLPLTEVQIQAVRTLRGSLFQQWFGLPSGQTLELKF
jgi:hypothetical protein